jgi:hypothetical protein
MNEPVATILLSVLISALVAFLVARPRVRSVQKAGEPNDLRRDLRIGIHNDGEVIVTRHLALIDSNGSPRAALIPNNEGAVLAFWDKNGKARLQLGLSDTDGPYLNLRNAEDKLQVQLSEQKAGYRLVFFDKGENACAVFGTTKDGATVEFGNPDGKTRAVLGVEHGNSACEIFDQNGNKRIMLGLDDLLGGGPFLHMWNEKLKGQLSLVVDGTGPKISLHDREEAVRAHLGVVCSPSSDESLPVFMLSEWDEKPDTSRPSVLSDRDSVINAIRQGKGQEVADEWLKTLTKPNGGKLNSEKTVCIFPGLIRVGSKRL